MRYGEYCESVGVDFLFSDKAGYSDLRQKVRQPDAFAVLTRRHGALLRPAVADRYGIRTLLDVDGEPIEFDDLNAAVDHLRDNPHRLDECLRELQMHGTPKAVLWDRIKRLVS